MILCAKNDIFTRLLISITTKKTTQYYPMSQVQTQQMRIDAFAARWHAHAVPPIHIKVLSSSEIKVLAVC